MAYYGDYYDTYDYYDDDDDGDVASEDEDYFVDCKYCTSQVLESNYDKHLERVHKCRYCKNYMPKESIQRHIQEKHMRKCSHCHVVMLETKINQHISTHNNRSVEGPIGMIQLGKLNDAQFNKLIKENRVYAKDGQLFVK